MSTSDESPAERREGRAFVRTAERIGQRADPRAALYLRSVSRVVPVGSPSRPRRASTRRGPTCLPSPPSSWSASSSTQPSSASCTAPRLSALASSRNWSLFNAGQLGNYLPMQVGTLYRFRYLKSVHGMRYPTPRSLPGDEHRHHAREHRDLRTERHHLGCRGGYRFSLVLTVIFVAMIAVAIGSAVVALPPFSPGRKGRFVEAWLEFHRGWETVRAQPRAHSPCSSSTS